MRLAFPILPMITDNYLRMSTNLDVAFIWLKLHIIVYKPIYHATSMNGCVVNIIVSKPIYHATSMNGCVVNIIVYKPIYHVTSMNGCVVNIITDITVNNEKGNVIEVYFKQKRSQDGTLWHTRFKLFEKDQI